MIVLEVGLVVLIVVVAAMVGVILLASAGAKHYDNMRNR